MNTIGDQQLVKRINRSVLLRLLRARPGLSRARLAQESGLTKSTVGLLVRELLQEGWLRESDASVADGAGRPSTPLAIDVGVRALAGIEIGVQCVRLACVSLQGELLHSDEQALADAAPPAVCRQVATLAAQAHRALSARGMRLAGIGVGVPGAVDHDTGRVRFAPNLGWRDLTLLPLLVQAFAAARVPEVPLQLQNEADAAALGEYEFGNAEEDADPLVFVNCDVGVGAGVVLNDRLFLGAQGMAGEIGHTILQMDGPPCSCGRRGCAEAFFGLRALTRDGADRQQAAAYLGLLLQNLWMTFNPRLIVVGGASCVAAPDLLALATDTVRACADAARLPPPLIRPARYGALAPAVGASAFVLHEYLRPLHPAPRDRVAQRKAAAT